MTKLTKQIIIKTSKELFAKTGYEGFSMRVLAKESGVGLSSIYHFFEDKDVLLRYIFDLTRKELGEMRRKIPQATSASDMLYDRIMFQFEHAEDVTYILKYYLHFRHDFAINTRGYIPTKAYLHIDEVVRRGVETREFTVSSDEIEEEAKVITHAINGFLLEYYPAVPTGEALHAIVQPIHRFIVKGLTHKEVVMK